MSIPERDQSRRPALWGGMDEPLTYRLVIFDAEGDSVGDAEFPADDDREAVAFAFTTASPFGHELWCEQRFLGRFEARLSNPRGEDAED